MLPEPQALDDAVPCASLAVIAAGVALAMAPVALAVGMEVRETPAEALSDPSAVRLADTCAEALKDHALVADG